jgi:hypothetical protein
VRLFLFASSHSTIDTNWQLIYYSIRGFLRSSTKNQAEPNISEQRRRIQNYLTSSETQTQPKRVTERKIQLVET